MLRSPLAFLMIFLAGPVESITAHVSIFPVCSYYHLAAARALWSSGRGWCSCGARAYLCLRSHWSVICGADLIGRGREH